MRSKERNVLIFFMFILLGYFIIQTFLAQNHLSNPDEGTHVIIGLFFRDVVSNMKNFRSFSGMMNFATNFVVKYPKVTASYPPLYHTLLATVLFMTESVLALRILNIIITILAAFVIYKLAFEMVSDKRIATLSSIFFLSFSTIFWYANMIMMDILQILTFSMVLWYYLKLKKKKIHSNKEIAILGVLLAVAFLTKFFSVFLVLIILGDSIFQNKKLFKTCLLSLVLSVIIISPYLFLYIKFGLYKLAISIASHPFGSNWEYFDIFTNFGIFIGLFVAASVVWFVWKNIKDPFIITWFVIPLVVLLSFKDSNIRFSFFLMPFYAIASAIAVGKLEGFLPKNRRKLLILFISALLIFQLAHNVYLNYGEIKYPIDEIMGAIENNGNIFVVSEQPVYSSVYILYGYFNDAPGNIMRPCALEGKDLTDIFLDNWGIRYVIDQENIINDELKSSLNLTMVEDRKFDSISIRLFETGMTKEVDCNFVCLLKGKVCKDDGFGRVVELIHNVGSTESG